MGAGDFSSQHVQEALGMLLPWAAVNKTIDCRLNPVEYFGVGAWISKNRGYETFMVPEEKGLPPKKEKVEVFISKKEYDADTVDNVKENLVMLAPGRLVFHDSREMPKGVKWKEWILEKPPTNQRPNYEP